MTRVVYFAGMPSEDTAAQVAVNTAAIKTIDRELDRCRERLHALESGQVAVTLLSRAVTELTESMPVLARQAARAAVDEFMKRRHADALANWRTYAGLLSAGAAVGSLVVAFLLR